MDKYMLAIRNGVVIGGFGIAIVRWCYTKARERRRKLRPRETITRAGVRIYHDGATDEQCDYYEYHDGVWHHYEL